MEISEQKVQELNEKMKKFQKRSSELENIENELNRIKENLSSQLARVNSFYKEIKVKMEKIEVLRNNEDKLDYSNDIRNILQHNLVDKIDIDGNNLIITTHYIDIYDEDGNKYKGNKYRLNFDYEDMICKIFGLDEQYCRKSCWTDYDPHPHVSGYDGYACWGSAGSMLCQTMNEFELYASLIIVINFLQQVNTEDVAGKRVKNWDCIDEDGNIIDNPHYAEDFTCTMCDYTSENEEYFEECEDCGALVCESCYRYIEDFGYICDNCIDEGWTYCRECSEYERNEQVKEINGEWYCNRCINEYFTKCEECGEYVKDVYITIVEDTDICDECRHNIANTCHNCDEWFFTKNMKMDSEEDYYYCEDCYEQLKEEGAL